MEGGFGLIFGVLLEIVLLIVSIANLILSIFAPMIDIPISFYYTHSALPGFTFGIAIISFIINYNIEDISYPRTKGLVVSINGCIVIAFSVFSIILVLIGETNVWSYILILLRIIPILSTGIFFIIYGRFIYNFENYSEKIKENFVYILGILAITLGILIINFTIIYTSAFVMNNMGFYFILIISDFETYVGILLIIFGLRSLMIYKGY